VQQVMSTVALIYCCPAPQRSQGCLMVVYSRKPGVVAIMVPLMLVCWCHQCLQSVTAADTHQALAICCHFMLSAYMFVCACQSACAAGGAHAAAIQVCSLVAETPQLAACIMPHKCSCSVVSKAPHTVVLVVI